MSSSRGSSEIDGRTLLVVLCEWPGYSPDFNAIELMWNIIKTKIKSKNPKSQRELEMAVDEACKSLSLNTVQRCIEKTQSIYLRVVDEHLSLYLSCTASSALSEYNQEKFS